MCNECTRVYLQALPKKIKKNRASRQAPAAKSAGRVAQRNRTRRAIVDAAMHLVAAGGTPSITEIAEAAQVSRRTVYMYFPTLEQLLIDAMLGTASMSTIEPVIAHPGVTDPVMRAEQLSRAMNRHSAETMQLGRALIRLTVEGVEPPAGGPRRGYRRVQWIEQALAPARERLTRQEFDRLVSALCVLIGWEPMIVLQDVRGLEAKQGDDVLAFAVRAVVEKALTDTQVRGKGVRS
jgi:AcrR family transcriptional regulator